ncbi:MAG: type II toxin-antitoxin system VapC family toxin [Methylococcales bacterium]|nr:type II toxin-antitoxin system VapC family toxin [Methylococcales bacterium]
MGEIAALLARMCGKRVYMDTNVFIYFLEQSEGYYEIVAPIIEACEAGKFMGYTGDVAVAETMIQPYRQDNLSLVANFKAFFATENFLSIQSHDAAIFDFAAQLRAKRGMKLIDALHYATALKAGCSFFLSNDAGIKSDAIMEVIAINTLLKN